MNFRKLPQTCFGLVIAGSGVFLALHSGLGVSPWDVLHVGLARLLHVGTGTAIILTSLGVLLISILLGVKTGLGTLCDIILVGSTVNFYYRFDPITGLTSNSPLLLRIATFTIGVFITALGVATYVGAHIGAGPRDGLMVALHNRFGIKISYARLILEGFGLLGGLILRGPVGLGTLIWSISMGYFVGFWFKRLKLTPQPVSGP